MAFLDLLFDPDYSLGASGGPGFNTTVMPFPSGEEQRNQNWEYFRGEWDVSHALKDNSDLENIRKFFITCRGRAHTFRFLDWLDYTIEDQVLDDSFDGTIDKEVQIIKKYLNQIGTTYTRIITKPVDVSNSDHTLDLDYPSYKTMTVLIGGSPAVEDTDYEINYSNGKIKDLIGVSGNLTVTCSYHNHCRFNIDRMIQNLEFVNYSTWGQIPIVELKHA